MESVLDDCLAQFSSKYVLKEEQCQAVLGLLEQEDVVAVLTTGFGKILIYQRQFLENICSEDDLRSRIFRTFFVKFLACLPLL